MWLWVTFCFNPNCYLIVRRGLQVQPIPNDLHPSPSEEKKRNISGTSRTTHWTFSFQEKERWVFSFVIDRRLDVFFVTDIQAVRSMCEVFESYIESHVNLSTTLFDVMLFIRPYDHCSRQYCVMLDFSLSLYVQETAHPALCLCSLSQAIMSAWHRYPLPSWQRLLFYLSLRKCGKSLLT